MSNTLVITEDGKLSVEDYRSIYRAILIELCNGPQKIFELVQRIHKNYIEFKYLDLKVIVNALGELIKNKLVVSTYEANY